MWLWYVLIAFVSVLLLYLFLVCPGNGKKASKFAGRYVAHRGLHGEGIVENTLAAFELAVAKGYGVELDIQLSSDGILVVAHDYDLKRVFGDNRKVSELSADELVALGVPRLETVLAVLDGKGVLGGALPGIDAVEHI